MGRRKTLLALCLALLKKKEAKMQKELIKTELILYAFIGVKRVGSQVKHIQYNWLTVHQQVWAHLYKQKCHHFVVLENSLMCSHLLMNS